MRAYQLRSEIVVPTSLEETFRLFENPRNLTKITPAWLGFEILTRDIVMRKGVEIDYRFRWLGVPLKWRTLVNEYEPPFLFEDVAIKSPYALWKHRHTFRRTAHGTVVGDVVDYALPLGAIGRLAHQFIVHKQVKAIFEHRQEALRTLLGQVTELQQPIIVAG